MDSELSPVKFTEIGTVPKIPLQRLLKQQPRSIEHTVKPSQSHQQTSSGTTVTNNDTVMQSQKVIADLLIFQHKQTSLPTREIPVFNGDPLYYKTFVEAFQHGIAECQKVNAQQHEAKIEFLRKNGVCFGCLRVGHMSKYCKRRMTCQTCQDCIKTAYCL